MESKPKVFTKVDDMLLKVGASVATAILIAVLFFGMKVYAFMEAGDRFTPEDALTQMEYVEDHYVQMDVYERDLRYIREQMNRIEKKLDLLLTEK